LACITDNKSFDFCADPHHDPGLGIFNGLFYHLRNSSANNMNVAESSALAQVCAL